MSKLEEYTFQKIFEKIMLVISILALAYGLITVNVSASRDDNLQMNTNMSNNEIDHIPVEQDTPPETSVFTALFGLYENNSEPRNKTITGYTTIWIEGKSHEECIGPGNEHTDLVIQCETGYFEKIPVYK